MNISGLSHSLFLLVCLQSLKNPISPTVWRMLRRLSKKQLRM